MVILLLVLLVIAIGITLTGLWLTPKKSAPPRRGVSYAAGQMNVRRPARYNHAVGVNRRMSVRRSAVEVERRAWSDILSSLNITRLFAEQKRRRKDTPWLGITLVLVALFLFGVFFLRSVLPNSTLFSMLPDNPITSTSNTQGNNSKPNLVAFTGASKALVRISQLDPAQYNSVLEYNTWWPSACSAASMTEVINSYGHNYRVTDILKAETGVGEITPDAGLLAPHGLDKTLAKFNFTTHWLYNPSALPANPSVDSLIALANNGNPVIINFPPSRWAGGHLLVALGGNKDYVYLADSSRLNMRAMDRKTFLKYWVGFAVVATPGS